MCDGSSRSSRAIRAAAHILVAAPAVVLVFLFLHPDTAWLVRAQCRLLYSPQDAYVAFKDYQPSNTPRPVWLRRRLAEVAQQHPDDYLIQLASLVEHRFPSEVNLHELLPRFGDRPALLAHILRYDVAQRVRIRRAEETAFYPPSQRPNPQRLVPPSPEYLAAYDRVAAEGEQLDPENAYFPLMRAVGLFAAHRDEEAIEAIERASRKPRWDDYTREEAEARLHLLTTAFGRQCAFSEFLNASVVFETHWTGIRSVARMVLYLAHREEKAGRPEKGANLRLSILRCASLIRAQSSSSIGALVAAAMEGSAVFSPDNVRRPNETEEQRRLRIRERFPDLLRRMRRDADASWVQREFAAMNRAGSIIREGSAPHKWLQMPLRLVRAWTMNMLWLSLFLGVLLLWLAYSVLDRTPLRRGIAPYVALLMILLIAGVLLMLSPWASFPAQMLATLAYLVKAEGFQPEFITAPPLIFRVAAATSVVFLLLMMVTAAGIWGLIRGRDPDVALVEGVRQGAMPIAGVLLTLYLVSVLHTARLETAWQQELQALRQHAGKYYAKQLGKTWPP